MSIEFTRLSDKGQIVVPSEIRKRMKLGEGTRFVIVGLSDTIILRKVELSQESIRLRQLLAKSREKANKIGFTQQQVERLIESSRKVTE